MRRKWEIGFELISMNTLIANEKCEVELSRFNGHSSSPFFFPINNCIYFLIIIIIFSIRVCVLVSVSISGKKVKDVSLSPSLSLFSLPLFSVCV